VQQAKEYITQAILRSQTAAGHSLLNSFWQQR
jgi:hydroxymethylpyrimidine/phosphomethylpyrimidine kinase